MLRQSYIADLPEAGCDEAGRGCLAGPVVAAAVILPAGYKNHMLNDSKKLSVIKRGLMRMEIEKSAVAWGIGLADNNEIDNINILNASILAMHRALSKLTVRPEHILVDGNRFRNFDNIPHTCIVRGDSLFLNIAAASILAKTHRDAIMMELHKKIPIYGWDRNKGYPTAIHIAALHCHGSSSWHRKSFRLKPRQASIRFGD